MFPFINGYDEDDLEIDQFENRREVGVGARLRMFPNLDEQGGDAGDDGKAHLNRHDIIPEMFRPVEENLQVNTAPIFF